MPRPTAVRRSQALLATFAAKDLDALTEAIFRLLTSVVHCDFVSAFYRYTERGLLTERDSLGRRYDPDFIRRFIELTPAIPAARAQPGVSILTTRALLPRRAADLKRSEFYREIMHVQGWRHGVALCFWEEPPAEMPMFVASVYRREGRADFSRPDVAALAGVHPFISCALARLYESETTRALKDGMAMTVSHRAAGVAVLDRNICLVEANAAARRLAATWGDAPSTAGSRNRAVWRVPRAVADACLELRRHWEAGAHGPADGAPRRRRVSHPSVAGIEATVTMICRNPAGLSDPAFVVEFAQLANAERGSQLLEQMTTSEREIAMVLIDGLSNQEIADEIGKSVHAVKFLLHRIYRRVNVPSRAALVAALRAAGR